MLTLTAAAFLPHKKSSFSILCCHQTVVVDSFYLFVYYSAKLELLFSNNFAVVQFKAVNNY